MTDVRIYRPAKSAMQSGKAKTGSWLLEYELPTARQPESMMGWVSSEDTFNQIKLYFDTVDEAAAYAAAKGWNYTVLPSQGRIVVPRNYVDNFKYIPPVEGE